MKKRLLFLMALIVAIVCLLTLSVSASIKKFPTDEFQTGENITYLEGLNVDAYLNDDGKNTDITTLIDDTAVSRVVVQNSDGTYTTYPSWYFFDFKYDWKGDYPNASVDRINALSEITGETYEISDVVRVEYIALNSEGIKIVRKELQGNSNEYGRGFHNAKYVYVPSYFTTLSNAFSQYNVLEEVVFAPNSQITSVGKNAFLNCYKLKKIVLPNTVTTIVEEGIRFYSNQDTSALEEIRLGAGLTTLSKANSLNTATVPGIKVYVPETLDGATYNYEYFPTTATIIFTGTKEQAEAFGFTKVISAEEYALAGSPSEAGTIVYGYNKCDAFYGGKHSVEADDCTVGGTCTRCQKSVKEEKHALTHTLVYANGFDNTGVYNYYCTNENCTIAGTEVENTQKGAIITFKGYSTPEVGNVKAINAGYKVEKELLALYNEVNEVDATLTLFMVNGSGIDAILKENTLELASDVKGINVEITSASYTDISIEVRGFDNSSSAGNYYTLKLITAIAVKTESGIHYVQAGLKNATNETTSVGQLTFNVVSADKVYTAVGQ